MFNRSKILNQRVLKTEVLLSFFYFVVLLLLSYYVFFNLLGEKTLHIWDESRNAASAVEMQIDGNVLSPSFNGKPDMWNTKPPLLIATQALFVNLFGISENSVRLPSAIAALAAVLAIFFFVSRYTKSTSAGFLSAVVLITSPELLVYHGVRSADFEAFLMFFSIAYSLLIFAFVETGRKKFLYFGISCFILAFFSKSTASLLFIPGIITYVLATGKLLKILQNKKVYFAVLAALVTLLTYYLLRGYLNAGYIKAVLQNEFGARVFNSLESHDEVWYFYIKTLWENGFKAWYSIIFIGLGVLYFEKSDKIKKLFVYCLILVLSHLVLISLFKTKLIWYVIPEFPFWSILTALSVIMIIRLGLRLVKNGLVYKLLPVIITLLLVLAPTIRTLKTVKIVSLEEQSQKSIKLFLRNEFVNYDELIDSKVKFISSDLKQNTYFYVLCLRELGYSIEYTGPDNICSGDVILLNGKEKLSSIISTTMLADTILIYNEEILAYRILDVNK
jgi:4-amino-4-deoxy-L-arabinose transferase-like glycosyltransferase